MHWLRLGTEWLVEGGQFLAMRKLLYLIHPRKYSSISLLMTQNRPTEPRISKDSILELFFDHAESLMQAMFILDNCCTTVLQLHF